MKRGAPLKRKTRLRAKRPAPRRDEGRIEQRRIKPKATSSTTEETAHVAHVKSLGCLICGKPANAHHVMHAPGKRCRRDDRFVAPLCEAHHTGRWGVHGIGSESGFRDHWGVDLVGWCMAAWSHRNAPDGAFWSDSVTRWRGIAYPVLMRHKSERGAPKDEQRRSTRSNPTPTVGGIEL